MLTLDSIPKTAPDVIGRALDGEAVLVIPGQAQVKVINSTGAAIWSLVDGTRSIREIARCLCQEFAVDLALAEQDTLEFVADLATRGIVRIA